MFCGFGLKNCGRDKERFDLIIGRHQHNVVINGQNLFYEHLIGHDVVQTAQQLLQLGGGHTQLSRHMLQMDEQGIRDLTQKIQD